MKNIYRFFGLSFIIVLIDQIIKFLIATKLNLYQSIILINPFLKITYLTNKGASWGILNNNVSFITIITAIFAIYFVKYIYSKKDQLNSFSLIATSFLFGGLMGNLIDRLFRGYVIDYLDVLIFKYNFPIFNFADSLIVIGTLLIIIELLRSDKNEHHCNR